MADTKSMIELLANDLHHGTVTFLFDQHVLQYLLAKHWSAHSGILNSSHRLIIVPLFNNQLAAWRHFMWRITYSPYLQRFLQVLWFPHNNRKHAGRGTLTLGMNVYVYDPSVLGMESWSTATLIRIKRLLKMIKSNNLAALNQPLVRAVEQVHAVSSARIRNSEEQKHKRMKWDRSGAKQTFT